MRNLSPVFTDVIRLGSLHSLESSVIAVNYILAVPDLAEPKVKIRNVSNQLVRMEFRQPIKLRCYNVGDVR